MAMKRRLLICALVLGLSPPAIAGWDEGVAAYGRGDHAAAYREWLPLAEAGEARAQAAIGGLYQLGHGVPQDQIEAIKWYRAAGERGLVDAQYTLGAIYEDGLGTARDYAAALQWYRRAADQNHAKAQLSLGRMYILGLGVSENNILAHMWYSLAAANWPSGAERNVAAVARDLLARGMSATELSRSQDLSRSIGMKAKAAPVAIPAETPATAAPPVIPDGDPLAATPSATVEKVRTAQLLLAALGFDPGPVDGTFGAQTRNAVRAFQASIALPADGKINDALIEALVKAQAGWARPAPAAKKP